MPDWRFLRNVLLKAILLFVVFNLLFAALLPAGTASLGRISAYNLLFPGRLRFPFGEDPTVSYNLSLYDLDAMFASHVLAAGSKPADEYRVLLVGDSSVWGTLLHPQDTLAGQLNAAGLTGCSGKAVRFYNLGYPTLSLTKDLMVLSKGMAYHPDLVIWLVTLQSFPRSVQLASPLVANNPALVDGLIKQYGLQLDPNDPALVKPDYWQQTIIGQRRSLADLLRLQLYGVMWAATGIDQDYPKTYTPAQRDFSTDASFNNGQPPKLPLDQLSFDALKAGMLVVGPKTPVLLVNEPTLISSGKNSDIRYNFYYPRWAYDQYRTALTDLSQRSGWNLLDLWNLEPEQQFTNSAIHLNPAGESLLAQRLSSAIQPQLCH